MKTKVKLLTCLLHELYQFEACIIGINLFQIFRSMSTTNLWQQVEQNVTFEQCVFMTCFT